MRRLGPRLGRVRGDRSSSAGCDRAGRTRRRVLPPNDDGGARHSVVLRDLSGVLCSNLLKLSASIPGDGMIGPSGIASGLGP
jgi:hypothetical protein